MEDPTMGADQEHKKPVQQENPPQQTQEAPDMPQRGDGEKSNQIERPGEHEKQQRDQRG